MREVLHEMYVIESEQRSKIRKAKYIIVAFLLCVAWGVVDTNSLFTNHPVFSKVFVSMLVGSNIAFWLHLMYSRKDV